MQNEKTLATKSEVKEIKGNIVEKPVVSDVIEEPKQEEIPVSLFSDKYNRPFASEYFGMKNEFILDLDIETKDMLGNIDDFIINYMNENDLKDEQKVYSKVLDSAIKFLKLDQTKRGSVIRRLNDAIVLAKFFKEK